MKVLPQISDPNLLVGINTGDDAAVYRLTDELALVQTVDFFPPIVDDPYTYGAISAANSLSDVYAKGATPLLAMNIVAFPSTQPRSVLAEILKGGSDKAVEAGVLIVGGHTIDDVEPKYGMSVTGLVKPGCEITNAKAKAGDVLLLTKPIGTGTITTAAKVGEASEAVLQRAVDQMLTLNRDAAHAVVEVGVNACTDVTGFGLLGHLWAMAKASGVGARIHYSKVPVIEGVWELAVDKGLIPGGTGRNAAYHDQHVVWGKGLPNLVHRILYDPQTSGGLLISVPKAKASRLEKALKQHGVKTVAAIGEMIADPESRVYVEA